MKNIILYAAAVLAVLFNINPSPAHCQSEAKLFNMLAVVPGMTQTIDIRQEALFPLGCPVFFIAALGKGTLGVSVKKDDVAGDTIFMLGAAVSGAGTEPVYRIGQSNGMIDQMLEIDPYGFVWIYCGVAFSLNTPGYNAQLRISLTP